MKKYIRKIILRTSMLMLITGCTDEFEKYNTNQYQIHQADPATLAKPMIETIVNIQQNDSQMQDQMVGQFGGYFTVSNRWAGTNFSTFNPSADWNKNPWNTPFEKIYGNFFQIQEATNSSGHYYSFARLIRAITMLRVTDCYGPMPYSQIQKGNFYVAYDMQEEVYKNILNDLTQAATVLFAYHKETNGHAPLGANDPVFNGDYSKWARLANSMKLRVAMRISNVWPEIAKEAAETAIASEAGIVETNNDNAMLSCGSQNNPYHLSAVSWGDLRVNANIVDYMNAYNDPRRSAFFKKSTIPGKTDQYVGMRTGDGKFNKGNVQVFSIPEISGTDPLMVFCAAETAFLRAEGKLRGWNVGEKSARQYYEEGITLSMQQHQVTGSDYMNIKDAPTVSHEYDNIQKSPSTISNTVSVKWEDGDNTLTGKNFQRIITQKWIANYPLGIEAWAEYRRTGYPEIYPCIDNLSFSGVDSKRGMRRLAFPYTEAQNNKTNYTQGVTFLDGPDNEVTELKWAKKN